MKSIPVHRLTSKPLFAVDNTMYLPKDYPDHEERLVLARNITSKWEPTTHNTTCIPQPMRYDKRLQFWPIDILRELNDLANRMPGDDGWNEFYDLVAEGHKKRMKDKTNTLPVLLQVVDLEYVRDQIQEKEDKGKQKMIDTDAGIEGMSVFDAVHKGCRVTDPRRRRFDWIRDGNPYAS
jgi:hypothetical protein